MGTVHPARKNGQRGEQAKKENYHEPMGPGYSIVAQDISSQLCQEAEVKKSFNSYVDNKELEIKAGGKMQNGFGDYEGKYAANHIGAKKRYGREGTSREQQNEKD